MAKIQSQKRVANDGAGPHCPFCRDFVEEGNLVECDQCQARYHKECVTSCVILGCVGFLNSIERKDQVKVGQTAPISLKAKLPITIASESMPSEGRSQSFEEVVAIVIIAILLLGSLVAAIVERFQLSDGLQLWIYLGLFVFSLILFFRMWPEPLKKERNTRGKSVGAEVTELEMGRAAEIVRPSRDNFYAKPNIAPPSSDPLQPGSLG